MQNLGTPPGGGGGWGGSEVELIYLRTRPQANKGYIYIYFQVIFHENLCIRCADPDQFLCLISKGVIKWVGIKITLDYLPKRVENCSIS